MGSSDSPTNAELIGVRPGGQLSGSSGVAGFIVVRVCARRVHAGSGFIGVRPGACRAHVVSLSLLVCALGVVRFIRGSWVHWGAPWGSLGSSRVAALYRVHPGV